MYAVIDMGTLAVVTECRTEGEARQAADQWQRERGRAYVIRQGRTQTIVYRTWEERP